MSQPQSWSNSGPQQAELQGGEPAATAAELKTPVTPQGVMHTPPPGMQAATPCPTSLYTTPMSAAAVAGQRRKEQTQHAPPQHAVGKALAPSAVPVPDAEWAQHLSSLDAWVRAYRQHVAQGMGNGLDSPITPANAGEGRDALLFENLVIAAKLQARMENMHGFGGATELSDRVMCM
jgi:hypothetical protein